MSRAIFSITTTFLFLIPIFSYAQTEIDSSNSYIIEDTIWTTLGSPYLVREEVVVESGVKLIIEPGVIVKFDYGLGITVFGSIEIGNINSLPVYFTSMYDDSVGGDSDGDGESEANSGDWHGVSILDSVTDSFIINTNINYSKKGIFLFNTKHLNIDNLNMLYNNDGVFSINSTIVIKDTSFNSTGEPISLLNSNGIIENLSIKNLSDFSYGWALEIFNNSKILVKGLFIEDIFGRGILVFGGSTIEGMEVKIKNVSEEALMVYNDSVGILENINTENTGSISVYNNSQIKLKNGNIKNNFGFYPLYFYTNSQVDLDNVKVLDGGIYSSLIAYQNTVLNIKNSVFDGGLGDGIFMFDGVRGNIKNTKIKNFEGSGIWARYPSVNVSVEGSLIENNQHGIFVIDDANISVEQSKIANNNIGVETFFATKLVSARNNYWGEISGPYNAISNPLGEGDRVSDFVDFNPWLTSDPFGEDTRTPVLIIPGIVGSELYNEDEYVWLNLTKLMLPDDHFLTENLSLDEYGFSLIKNIEANDVIKRRMILNIFDLNIFEGLENVLISDEKYNLSEVVFFPYDWRLDLDTTKDLLHQKIEQIKNETGSSKIDIVAHSMGGLLTKNYIDSYGEESINKLIFVGTPHLGAPKAGKVLLEGDSFSIPVLEKDRIKEISLNSPALHQLLPIQKYFDEYSGYLRKYKMFGQNPILNYSETKEFFIDEKNKNSYMFELAQNLENKKLYEKSFSGVDVYNIAGCKTATQDAYGMSILGRIGQTRYSSGDGTVPLVSADYINTDDNKKFYVKDGNHAKLPSTNGVRELILSILKNDSVDVHLNISNNKDFCDFKGKSLSWHSPVEVHIYDSFGNHTGPIDGGIEYGIVGVDYEIIGEEKFIFIPTNNNEEYLVDARGTDNGTFDLKISDILNGEYIKTKIYNDIQVNTNTEVKFTISEEENESIILGEDNEFYEIGFSSEIIGDGVEDLVPPETDAKVSVVINKKPKKSGLHFILRSEDVGTGVLGSYYSLDDGNNFYIYEEPIPITKDFRSILYYSIDRAGNNEDIKRMDLKSYVISNCKKDNKCIDVVFKHKKLTDVENIKKIELIKNKFIKFKNKI